MKGSDKFMAISPQKSCLSYIKQLDRYSLNQRKNGVALILAIYHVQNNNNLNGVNFLVNSSSIRVFLR